jgi:hypothetical protein
MKYATILAAALTLSVVQAASAHGLRHVPRSTQLSVPTAAASAPIVGRDGPNENWDYSLGRPKEENSGGGGG